MQETNIVPGELKLFLNHIYEFKKGIRNMVLFTMNRKYEPFAVHRLTNQRIAFLKQDVDEKKINLFFGKKECLDALRHIVNRPLNQLTPEEDFILGAMLGYDICKQCERYSGRKRRLHSVPASSSTREFNIA